MTTDPKLWKLQADGTEAHAPQQEKPPQWETRTTQLDGSPCLFQLEKAPVQQGRPSTAKNK